MRGRVAEGGGEQAGDKVREGIHAVHEDPETGKVVGASEDAAEGVEHDAEDGGNGAADVFIGYAGDHQVGEGGREEKGGHDGEDGEEPADARGAGCGRVAILPNGIVPNEETEYSGELACLAV